MAEEIVLKLEVDNSGAGRSLSGLRQEFKALQKELDNTQVGSEKYIQTLQKLGKVKDEIGDLNQTINAFHPEGKIQAIQNVVGGLASGFQAATAATALFGDENEDLTKTLVKVQSAMAFADGIKGVMALGDSFAVLNTIIAANPVMAVVTGLALLTGAVVLLTREEEKELKTEKELNEEKQKRIDADKEIANFTQNIISKISTEREAALRRELELLKSKDASISKIYSKERELLNQQLKDLEWAQKNNKDAEKEFELNQKILDVKNQLLILENTYNKQVSDNTKQRIKEEEQVQADMEAMADQIFAESMQKEADHIKQVEDLKKENEKTRVENNYKHNQALIKINSDSLDAQEKREKDALLAWTQAQNEKLNGAAAMANSMQSLSNSIYTNQLQGVQKGSAEELKIKKKQFETNKKFQVAQTIITTARGAMEAYAALAGVGPVGPVLGALAAGAVIASGAIQIDTIKNTKFDSGGASVSAPTAGTTNIPNNNNSGGGGGNTQPEVQTQAQTVPVRAYVVEQDVTTAQNMARVTRSRAAFS